MSWISDAHQEWHHANLDRPWDCPLDCGAGEPSYAEEQYENALYYEELELARQEEYDYSVWVPGMEPVV
ncbi:MAG TPA: hypothetical protein VN039_04640 [Nitrospira sp.]|jgi:hypothetical protein|nr:hypothetical protein [Nitrospira sp.]